ncbi:MAG: M1 family metallopeptidase [Planctomycetota bacterium]
MLLALRAFFAGLFPGLRRLKLVLLLYAATAVLALALVQPLWRLVAQSFAHATTGATLKTTYDWEAVLDFLDNQAAPWQSALAAVQTGGLLFFLLGTLFLGGVLALLTDPTTPATLAQFAKHCGRLFCRCLRAEIVCAALVVGVYFANLYLAKGVRSLFVDWLRFDASSRTLALVMLGKNLIALFLLGLVLQAVMFAKIGAAMRDHRSMVAGTLRGLGMVLRHPIATSLPFLLSSMLLVAVPIAQGYARDLLPTDTVLLFERVPLPPECAYILLTQLAALVAWWLLVARCASQVMLYRALAPLGDDDTTGTARPLTVVDVEEPAPAGRSRVLWLAFPLVLGGAPLTRAQDAAHSWNNAYRLTATLVPEARTLKANEQVTFTNTSDREVAELQFHLYANAFANDRTLWMREAKEVARVRDHSFDREEDAGYIQIDRVRRVRTSPADAGTGELSANARIDGTLMVVPLAPSLPPHASVEIEIEFTTRLPTIIARMGVAGDHFDGMQWFPKLGVFADGNWVCPPFHAATEFFADFGTYDVVLTVPRGYQVEATGIPAPPSLSDANATFTYHAENVHDFAFCADPHVTRKVRTHGKVEIVYLCQPYALAKAERVLDVVARCLDRYGEWFLPYPYPRIVVDGMPFDQSGGMEYPMLFTISERAPHSCSYLIEQTQAPVGVTIHEFGHQYWYGLLASNEFDEAWLDEGVNSYVSLKLEDDWFGPTQAAPTIGALEFSQILLPLLNDGFGAEVAGLAINPATVVGFNVSPFYRQGASVLGYQVAGVLRPGLPRSRWDERKRDYFKWAGADTLATRSYELYPGSAHVLTYSKTALALRTLENHFGWEAMKQALKTYAQRFAFTHPTGKDFFAVLEESLGVERARPFIDQLFRGQGTLDYAVTELDSQRVASARGFATQTRPGDPVTASFAAAADKNAPFASRVIVRNLGTIELPVDVRFTFADGTTRDEAWDGRGWRRFSFGPGTDHETLTSELVAAEVDPDRRFAIDLDVNNNGRRLERNQQALTTLCAWLTYWVETYLTAFAFFW